MSVYIALSTDTFSAASWKYIIAYILNDFCCCAFQITAIIVLIWLISRFYVYMFCDSVVFVYYFEVCALFAVAG